ncbi:hypothetical protein QTP88_008624 [Uroleucon formosanum]
MTSVVEALTPKKKNKIDRKFQVVQHLETAKHISNRRLKEEKTTQPFIKKTFNQVRTNNQNTNEFNKDLCNFMVANDISLFKLNNPQFKLFFEKYLKLKLPDESTLRKNYSPLCYDEVLCKIRNEIGNSPIWVSIDETIDVQGRYVASLIIGKLSSEECTKPIVLTVEQLQKANFQTISQLFNDSMSILWPEKIFHEKVLLYVTDAAPYMVKSGEALKVFYPKLIHVTYMAHGLHRVAEAIREKYQNVDRLISNSKKIFLKAPSRVNTFKEMYPNLSLPPQSILTRWGTWLEAAIYYGKYFNECIIDTITKLEKSNVTLRNSVLLIENIKIKFEEGGPGIDFARSKFTNVLSKNRGYSTLKKINCIINGEVIECDEDEELSVEDLSSFKYAPIVSCDVERSFSKYKSLSKEYKDASSEIGNWLKWVFGLPLLNPEEVSDCFTTDLMSVSPDDERIIKFCDYLVEYYIFILMKVQNSIHVFGHREK